MSEQSNAAPIGWQPIETLPFEAFADRNGDVVSQGTPVLILCNASKDRSKGAGVTIFHAMWCIECDGDGYWLVPQPDSSEGAWQDGYWKATHWMPTPPAPATHTDNRSDNQTNHGRPTR